MNRLAFVPALLILALSLPAYGQESARDTTIAFGRAGTVSISARSGDIVVTASSRNEVRVRTKDGRAKIRLDAANRLNIDPADGQSHDVAFEVSVPLGVRIIARSDDGDITIRGTSGDVDAHTETGEIHVQGASGHIEVTSLSGDIDATDLKGGVTAQGVSTTIKLAHVTGDVSAESVSGDVSLRDITSRNVRAHSTTGDVIFDGAIDSDGRYELASNSSDVSITIAANVSARITVATWSGSIDSDFPITLHPGERNTGAATTKQFSFDVGGGAARIHLETFSGDIRVHRRGK